MQIFSKKTIYLLLIFSFAIIIINAQESDIAEKLSQVLKSQNVPDKAFKQPDMISKMAIIAGLSLLPFAVMLFTSFIKIIIVFSLLRNALGVQQTPPNQVLTGTALIITIYVMFPTCLAMYNSSKDIIEKDTPKELFSDESVIYLVNVIDKAKEPFKDFLKKNVIIAHKIKFYQLAYKLFPEPFKTSLNENDFIILLPSFITSQLKCAFEIGVLIYLPFFVIDLVTSNILLAMGMMMLSPLTIALPIKLLLLVMIDGWTILIQGLILTFK